MKAKRMRSSQRIRIKRGLFDQVEFGVVGEMIQEIRSIKKSGRSPMILIVSERY